MVEVTGWHPDADPTEPSPNPLSAAALRARVERDFAAMIPPGKKGAAVVVATPRGARFGIATRLGDDEGARWALSVEGGLECSERLEGDVAVKLLGVW